MYAAYQVKNFPFSRTLSQVLGGIREKEVSKVVRGSLESLIGPDGKIDAAEMMKGWFPSQRFDVFISHSRADKDLAFSISGWLKMSFGISSFVDSCVWGHAHTLLRDLDETFCEIRPNLISYEESLITASHVHLMLGNALTQMMDRCECVLFLNTPNSVESVGIEQMVSSSGDGTTHSPWLFHEISLFRLLRRRPKEEHRVGLTNFSEDTRKTAASVPPFRYPVDLDGVPILGSTDLSRWRDQARTSSRSGGHLLDILYDIVAPQ